MHIIKLGAIAAVLASSVFATQFATASDIQYGQVDQGWDVFRSHAEGRQALSTDAYKGTSMGQGSGQGWDVFRSHAEGRQMLSTNAYMGTSQQSTDSSGRGHNIFRVGDDVRY